VEKAINNLKSAGALSPEAISSVTVAELARIIRPCGYYNSKAVKLKSFVRWLDEDHHGELSNAFALETVALRGQLLSVSGIGPETADSIILYAAGQPAFVIDAYTRRITARIGLAPAKASYHDLQHLFTSSLSRDARLFNEYHALLVQHAKTACRTRPVCHDCLLRDLCRAYTTGTCIPDSPSGKLSARA